MKKILFFLLLSLTIISCSETGKTFDTYVDFSRYQENKGYLKIGEFNTTWPAKITKIETSMNEITFQVKGENSHTYSGFTGYELKLVRLQTENGNEGVIVLRSKEKKESSEP